MISVTTKSKYALDALVELQRRGCCEPVPLADLAKQRDIPVQFLEQLFGTLRKAGLLASQRGVKGGYTFAKSPDEITALEVVELLDGEVGKGATGVFAEVVAQTRQALASVTICDAAARESQAATAAMYNI